MMNQERFTQPRKRDVLELGSASTIKVRFAYSYWHARPYVADLNNSPESGALKLSLSQHFRVCP